MPKLRAVKATRLSNHQAMRRDSVPGDVAPGTLPTRVPTVPVITSPCPLRSCLPPCPQPARGWRANAPRSWGPATCRTHRRGSWQRHPRAERAGDNGAQHPGGEAGSGGAGTPGSTCLRARARLPVSAPLRAVTQSRAGSSLWPTGLGAFCFQEPRPFS